MRRRRSPLKPDNFPFLAVLLCAMGALILLLLVMDRRARAVARAKALQTLARQTEEGDRALAARRADGERRRQQRHALLEQQEHETLGRITAVGQRLQTVARQSEAEEAQRQTLQQKLLQLRGQLAQSEQALTADRGRVEAAARQAGQSRGELAELTRELQTLEQVLKETREAREREQRTFSLVPYRGKHGDSRRPVYVECTAEGVLFHPEKVSLQGHGFSPTTFREEVERRLARLAALPTPAATAADDGKKKPALGAYLLFLIRPDGIDNYYRAVHSLSGVEFDFGYEFIDPDWVLDFSEDGAPARQPWLTAARAEPPPPAAGEATPTRPAPQGIRWPSGPPRGVAFGKNVSGSGLEPGGEPGGPPLAGPPDSPRPIPGTAAAGRGIAGSSSASAPEPWLLAGQPGFGGPAGGVGPAAVNAAGVGPLARPGNPAGSFPGPANVPAGGTGVPGPIFDSPGGTATPGRAGAGSGQGIQAADVSGPAGKPSGNSPNQQGPGGNRPAQPSQGGTSGTAASGVSGGGVGGAPERPPGEAQGDLPPGSRSAGRRWGGGGGSPSEDGEAGGPSLPPIQVPGLGPSPTKLTKRPPSPPLRVVGNRDWILRVECLPDAVVLYPSSRRFATDTLAPNREGRKELLQAVQQLVARRQASVRPGELPYRPQIRFLVRPEGVQTFFLAYPVLEPVGVPMNRQDVERDEDVR